MTKREVIKLALEHKPVPYTPWSFKFTKEAMDKLVQHYGDNSDIHKAVGNHIVEFGNDIGIF